MGASVIARPLRRGKRLWKRFLDGPDWIDKPGWLARREKKYRSPTVYLCLWLYAWYSRIFTIPGRVMASSVFLIVLYGVIFGEAIQTLAFILLAVLFVDFVVGFFFRPRLSVERETPRRVRAGEPIKVSYKLFNRRRLPAWNLHVDPVRQQGWLRLEADIALIDCVPGKSKATIHSYLRPRERGEYVLKPAFVSSSFPFGIFKWSCKERVRHKILIYPRFNPLNSVDIPMGAKFQREGMNMASKVGESMEFHACREFRVGDNPKHIHWPTTARRNELVVREFQEESLSRIALLADTYVPDHNKFFTLKQQGVSEKFEAALSIIAALSHHLACGDHVVDLFAVGPNVYHFKGGRSFAQFDQILDILACIEPNRKDAMANLEAAVLQEVAGIGSAIVALLRWDDARKRLVENLRSEGVSVKVLIIGDEPAKNAPPDAIPLSPSDIFDGKVRSI